jgi:hypothetical protein
LGHEQVLESEGVPSVDEELVLDVLGRVEVLAFRVLPRAATLDAIVASSDPPVLNLHVSLGMCEFALLFRPGALATLELPADLHLQPSRVLNVHQMINHCHDVVAILVKHCPTNGQLMRRAGDY